MITKEALESAIAECKGDPDPNAQTCMKLASYYTIGDHLFGRQEDAPQFSMDAGAEVVEYSGDSEFAQAVEGKSVSEIMPLIDELMQTVSVLIPPLYKSVMRKLR